MKTFPELVQAELSRARSAELHPTPQHSLEESYGVLMEEIDEFWQHVKVKEAYRCKAKIREELVHVAAMCQRAAEDNELPYWRIFSGMVSSICTEPHYSLHESYGKIAKYAHVLLQAIIGHDSSREMVDALVMIAAHAQAAYMLLEPVEKPYREECTQ